MLESSVSNRVRQRLIASRIRCHEPGVVHHIENRQASASGTDVTLLCNRRLRDGSPSHRTAGLVVVLSVIGSLSATSASAAASQREMYPSPPRHFTGCIERRISNRANVGVDALEVAQDVEMKGCRFQTLRPAFTQAFQMLLRRVKLGVT